MKRRFPILSALLSVLLVLTVFSAVAVAAEIPPAALELVFTQHTTGTVDRADDTWKEVAIPSVKTRFLKFEATTQYMGGSELEIVTSLGILKGSKLKIHSVSSEHPKASEGDQNYSASLMVDGDPITMWSTEYQPYAEPPHWIVIDLRSTFEVTAFRYLPRSDGYSGDDDGDWGAFTLSTGAPIELAFTQKHTGTVDRTDDTWKTQTVTPFSARFVKFETTSQYMGGSELKIVTSAGTLAYPTLALHSASSDHPQVDGDVDYAAMVLIDGDEMSMWSTEYQPYVDPPHWIVIDLGAVYEVTGFEYLPRSDGYSGDDDGDWGDYVLYAGELFVPSPTPTPSPTPLPTATPTEAPTGPSTGTIALIVVGAAIVIAIVVILVVRSKKSKK